LLWGGDMKHRFVWVGGACLALFVSGCGGASEGEHASCGDGSSCGGDIVGNWKITSSCLELDQTEMSGSMSCAGLKTKAEDVAISGNVAYNADKTYGARLTVTGNLVLTVPASCLTQQGVTVTCAQLQQSLQMNAAAGGYESASCSGSNGCSCTMGLVPQEQVSSGTYSTSAGTLTQTETGGTPEDSSFCVKGNSLTLSPKGGMSGGSGSIVLTRE
jgi:hypothetical protein